LDDDSTPQHKAFQWLVTDDKIITNYSGPLLAQRYAALVMYYAIRLEAEQGYLNGELHECAWGLYDCTDEGIPPKEVIVSIVLELENMMEVPNEIGLLTNLEKLDLVLLNLEFLPSTIGSLQNLKYLNVSSNLLNAIPTAIYELSSLEILDLSGNEMEGTIDEALGDLSNLKFLNLGDNSLSGKVPEALGNLSRLDVLRLNENALVGTIPIFYGLVEIALFQNDFSGNIPEFDDSAFSREMLRLEKIDFGNNRNLIGTVPSIFTELSSLTRLDFISNSLSGSIPSPLPPRLRFVRMSTNNFEFGLPSNIEELLDAESIDFSGNNLNGTIPEAIGGLSNLKVLDLEGNHFEGTLPSTIGNMSRIEDLDLSSNQLSGTLPTEIGKLVQLTSLSIGSNDFSGTIPAALGHLTNIGE